MSRVDDEALSRLSSLVGTPSMVGERYRLMEPIGRGAMGEVWSARDRVLDREVAIKICADARDAARARQRFEREARVVAQLEHPSIPPVHDAGETEDGRPWYAMRLLPGHTLADAASGLGSRAERLRVFLKLCEPVAHAHRRGFVHRDVKPENVMVGPSREVYVTDWGLARVMAGSEDDPDGDRVSAAGTPGYMAPEQGSGAAPDPRADVYSLGGVLLYLLTEQGGESQSRDGTPAGIQRPLAAIAARARATDPSLRYPDAAALAGDVAKFLDREPVDAYPESYGERFVRVLDRHRFVVWLIGGYLAFRLVVFFFFRS